MPSLMASRRPKYPMLGTGPIASQHTVLVERQARPTLDAVGHVSNNNDLVTAVLERHYRYDRCKR